MKPIQCRACHKPASQYSTDGNDLYIKGDKMPVEMVKAWLPCPHCDASLVWVRTRDRKVIARTHKI